MKQIILRAALITFSLISTGAIAASGYQTITLISEEFFDITGVNAWVEGGFIISQQQGNEIENKITIKNRTPQQKVTMGTLHLRMYSHPNELGSTGCYKEGVIDIPLISKNDQIMLPETKNYVIKQDQMTFPDDRCRPVVPTEITIQVDGNANNGYVIRPTRKKIAS